MDVYIYQADLYCISCGEAIKTKIQKADPLHWSAAQTDSDSYPQGPYPNGGNESDCPNYCSRCGCFLENLLTSAGYDYVQEVLQDEIERKPILAEWFEYYGFRVKLDN